IRTESHDANLKGAVGQLWGTSQRQLAPQVYYQIIKRTKINRSDNGGKLVTELVEEPVKYSLLLDSSDIRTQLNLEHRQKGLLWYSTYRVQFEGKYRVVNYTDVEREIFFDFSVPAKDSVYDNFRFLIGGKEMANLQFTSGIVSGKMKLAPGQAQTVEVSYGSQGLDEWWYDFGENVNQVKNFTLTMLTDFHPIDFPTR